MKMDPKTIAKDRKRCTKILKKVLKEKEGEEKYDAQAWKDSRNCKSIRCRVFGLAAAKRLSLAAGAEPSTCA